jgi:signal transduction histidine kinase
MAVLNEAYHHFFSAPVPQASAVPRELAFLPSDAPLYRLMLVSGSSLQILAQFLYLSYGEAALFFALGWFALAIRVHEALLKERLRLHRAFRELEASHRALAGGEPTARIVHQTRHQLGLIGISTHLIREGLRSARPDRAKILEQLGRLDGVVAALRRMLSEAQEPPRGGEEADAPERPPAPVLSLRDLVNEEVERLRGKAQQLGVALVLRPGPAGLLPRPGGDTEPLGQGIFNVIENALAAARRSVCVLVEDAEAEVRVVVEDDGPGMPADVLRRAGEPFVTTKEEGTGLGLFVAAAAARRWGGSLTLENRREGGLRAIFRLPRARPAGGTAVG